MVEVENEPCPFCGGRLFDTRSNYEDFIFSVECSSCGARGPYSRDKGDIYSLWNTRGGLAPDAGASGSDIGDSPISHYLDNANTKLAMAIEALKELDQAAGVEQNPGGQHG